ncbi:hypothetical protein FJZ41_02315 [Candidatus Shapirobacteria bacterium]|nr:hypothetical protein [Candidatus Shapirobacteria bacterium]
MIPRWKIKEKVRKLRGKGLSYKDIQKVIPVAKSTISIWCKDITLTQEQRIALGKRYDVQHKGAQVNHLKRKNEIQQIRNQAKQEIIKSSKNPFKVAGLMLYWAEGNKTQQVGVCNSDPTLIQFMMDWFRKVCNIPERKFKAYLNLHSGQDEKKVKKFWSKITKIPISQFGKTYIKPEGIGFKKNILYNGTIRIIICDKDLLYRILAWIATYKKVYKKGA